MEMIPPEFDFIHLLILLFAGIASGICNVLAGGGSLITMPLLIFMGLESATANGTNRVAIGIQNIFAVAGFRRKGYGNMRFCVFLIVPAIPGALLGAITASTIGDVLFKRILSAVMIMVLILILSRKNTRSTLPNNEHSLTISRRVLVALAFAGIGFYAGFIQAGVGFLVMLTLSSLVQIDLVKTNSYKVFVIGVLTWISVIVFIWFDRIVWNLSLVLATGSAIGGWLGSHIAVLGGEKWIKLFLTISVLAMALRLSGIF
jgi:uncharacterized protein